MTILEIVLTAAASIIASVFVIYIAWPANTPPEMLDRKLGVEYHDYLDVMEEREEKDYR